MARCHNAATLVLKKGIPDEITFGHPGSFPYLCLR
jgi:hypothetical protein